MTSRGPMYSTYISAGSDMIQFTGRPQMALGDPLNIHPKANQD